MKIDEIIKNGYLELKEKDDALLKVRLLLCSILNVEKEYLMIHSDEEISNLNEKDFFEKIELLKKDVPIQYIIHLQEFFGYDFYVDENVLIPQPDTEILVEEVISLSKDNYKILDMCTGSGAIAISLKKKLNNVEVYASDISQKALEVAKYNAKNLNAQVNFIESDLFENIEFQKYDLIVSNPPYIKKNVMNNLPEEVKKEPHLALEGGNDGLDFYRKISQKSKEYLKESGILAFEIGYDQKEDVINILKENGYKNIYSKKDFGGNDRIVVAQS